VDGITLPAGGRERRHLRLAFSGRFPERMIELSEIEVWSTDAVSPQEVISIRK